MRLVNRILRQNLGWKGLCDLPLVSRDCKVGTEAQDCLPPGCSVDLGHAKPGAELWAACESTIQKEFEDKQSYSKEFIPITDEKQMRLDENLRTGFWGNIKTKANLRILG